MAITNLNPYLLFNGTAAKAIALYERTLGARTEGLSKFGDVPETKPEDKDRVMHAMLHVGGGVLMVSDAMPSEPVKQDTSAYVCLHFDDVADMTAKFDALAEGGKVTMALNDTFWGAKFGTLTDAFGVNWMFNCMLKKD